MHANTQTTTDQLRHANGEALLLLAVFGPPKLKSRIDRELDRRALTCSALGGGALGRNNGLHATSGHAA
jgi:hypothetical protein